MSINGWFPRLHANGDVASGNAGIWLSPIGGSPSQVSAVGIGPNWSGDLLVFNRNNGTTQVGATIIPVAYNDYVGSDDDRWSGFLAPNNGQVDVYRATVLLESIPNACRPRLAAGQVCYLTPYQTDASNQRDLIVNGQRIARGVIADFVVERAGRFIVFQVATGTYTRELYYIEPGSTAVRVSIRTDEAPLSAFIGPDGEPWIMSGTNDAGTFVRPVKSSVGYRIDGDLYYPDARMVDQRLRVVGSFSNGEPRFDVWIDFTSPRVDLVPPTPLPPVVLPDRPLWVGCFEFQQSPQGPGNIAVAVRNISGPMARVVIVSSESRAVVSGDIAGEFVSGGTVDAVETAAKTLKHRPVAYWDDNRWPRWPVLPDGSWLCVRAYQPVGQSLEDFEASVGGQIESAPSTYPVALVGQAYTQLEPPPSVLTKDLAPLQRILLRLAAQHRRVVSLLLFCGYGRAGGLQDHPNELAFWTGIVPQIARPPIDSLKWPPVTPPDPPKPQPSGPFKLATRIEVSSMSATRIALRLGQYFASVDPTAKLDADGYRVDAYGRGPFKGFYPVRFLKETQQTDAHAAFLLSQPRTGDPKLLVRPEPLVDQQCALSADATEFSGDIASQFGVKPNVEDADWGGYEAFNGWTLGSDQIDIILVEYNRDGQKYASANLTVVRL